MQALQLQLEQWAPYAPSVYHIVWQDDTALVWCWDAARLNQVLSEAKLDPRHVHAMPESVFYPPHADGMRLLKCLNGYEAQLWRGNRLVHSRWWPALPDRDAWLAFQRDASVQPQEQSLDVPTVAALALLNSPWANARSTTDNAGGRYEKFAVAGGALLLSLFTLHYGFTLIRFYEANQALKADTVQMQESGRPVLEARRLALDDLARIQALRELDAYPEQLALMAKVAETLPKNETTLKEWSFQNGVLKITLVSVGQLSSSALVSAFQTTGLFTNVKALPANDPKIMTLQMDVVRG